MHSSFNGNINKQNSKSTLVNKLKSTSILIFSLTYCISVLSQNEVIPPRILDGKVTKEIGVENSEVLQGVVYKSSLWNQAVVTVSFKGGTPELHDFIVATASKWTEFGAIVFDFGYDPIRRSYRMWHPNDTSDIRIGFDDVGNYSYLGTLSKSLPPGETTMNFENFDRLTIRESWKRTILHEFGHALGFTHEHQNKSANCNFNWDYLYAYYEINYGWEKEKVDKNILTLRRGGFVFTDHDPESVMHYYFDPIVFKAKHNSPCFVHKNTKLSDGDKKLMALYYSHDPDLYRKLRHEDIYEIIEVGEQLANSLNTEFKAYAEKKKKYLKSELTENSFYLVGLYALNVDHNRFEEGVSYLEEMNYSLIVSHNLHYSPHWLAKQSVVLYYDQNNKAKAQELANQLSLLTSTKFEIAVGKGLGVFNKTAQMFIHWVK